MTVALTTVPAWILMMKVLRLAGPEVPVALRPPRLCPSCWTGFVNAEPAVMQVKTRAAPSPCPSIKQPQPQRSDEEPPPSPSAPATSRSPGPAPASSNRPLRSCLALPALAPSVTLRHRPPPLQPNCPASARVTPLCLFPRCHTSPPSPPAIARPPCPFQRRTQSNPSAL